MSKARINTIKEEVDKNHLIPRYHLLDMIRGICIILVVIYHLIFNLSGMVWDNYEFILSTGMNFFRDLFVGVLVFVAGISSNLSRSNIKRGVKTLLCGMLVTLVTAIVMPSAKIIFGILQFFGIAMLLYALLNKLFEKLPISVGFYGFMLLFMLTLGVYNGYFGWPGIFVWKFPDVPKNLLLFILGFNTGHGSGDYWPIMPWLFLFFAGGFVGRLFKEKKVPEWFKANPVPALSFLGRKTLIIYLVHQPLIYGILFLLYNI